MTRAVYEYYTISRYVQDVVNLYKDYKNENNINDDKDSNEEKSNNTSNKNSRNDNGSCGNEGGQNNSSCKRETDSDTQEVSSEGRSERRKGSAEIKGIFEGVVNDFVNEKLITELTRIFTQSSKIKQMNGSAINAYSGVFDPRSAVREDYKYFLQKSRAGNVKAFSKVHLNLFLDRSGSFAGNTHIANEILYALSKIERQYPDFSYTVITCGEGETVEDKKDFLYSAWDGTYISSQIFDTFKKVQKRGEVNYNIVLYDGLAYDESNSKRFTDGNIRNFEAFNTSNTLIITDPDNYYATRWCPLARVVISKNYCEELIDNLIKMLYILTK